VGSPLFMRRGDSFTDRISCWGCFPASLGDISLWMASETSLLLWDLCFLWMLRRKPSITRRKIRMAVCVIIIVREGRLFIS